LLISYDEFDRPSGGLFLYKYRVTNLLIGPYKMKSFKEYHYIFEGRSRGEAMEEVIVSAVNGKPEPDPTFGIDAAAGEEVAKFLNQNGIKGSAKVLGADQMDVTKEWAKFWDGSVPSSTKTPKTDFIVGNVKISLKTGGAAQLMSGGKNESVATFYAALEKTKGNMQKELVDKLTNMFEGLAPSSVASGELSKVIKAKSDEIVNKANAAHKELMSELSGIFAKNIDFRDAFAYEAMSGEVKFGGNLGTCTHFLVTDFDGKNSALHSVSDSKYVSKIANQMKVSVRFKTTSVKQTSGGKTTKTGEYRYWSVVGLLLDKMHEDLQNMPEDMLTENAITDFFKNVWNRIKAAFKKAMDYVKENVKNLFDFLEVTPDVSFNNKVVF